MRVRSRSTVIAVPPIVRHSVPLTENSFVDWILDSVPGDKIVYYRGLLAHDRAPSAKVLDTRPRAELNAVAARVLTMASHGFVVPVQKRIGPNDFLYIAVKTQLRRDVGARAAPVVAQISDKRSKAPSPEPAPTMFAA